MASFSMCVMAQDGQKKNGIERSYAITLDVKPSSLIPKEGDNQSLLGLNGGFSILVRQKMLEFEWNLGLQKSFGSKKNAGASLDYKMFAFTFDVTLGYNYTVPNTNVRIVPFLGFGFENLISGSIKQKMGGISTTFDMKDRDDMGGEVYGTTLYLEGGVKTYFTKNIFAKLRYAHSVMNYKKDVGYQFFGIGAGLEF